MISEKKMESYFLCVHNVACFNVYTNNLELQKYKLSIHGLKSI